MYYFHLIQGMGLWKAGHRRKPEIFNLNGEKCNHGNLLVRRSHFTNKSHSDLKRTEIYVVSIVFCALDNCCWIVSEYKNNLLYYKGTFHCFWGPTINFIELYFRNALPVCQYQFFWYNTYLCQNHVRCRLLCLMVTAKWNCLFNRQNYSCYKQWKRSFNLERGLVGFTIR